MQRQPNGRGNPDPIRILMVVPKYPHPVVGGLERQAHRLAIALNALGCEVLALTGRFLPDAPVVEDVDGVRVHRLPWFSTGLHRRWVLEPMGMWWRFHSLRRQVDVVHVHVFSGFGLLAILLARIYGKPVLVKLPNVGAWGLPGLRNASGGLLRMWLFKRSTSVVAMSGESLRELDVAGFEICRVLATPNGLEPGPTPLPRDQAGRVGPLQVLAMGRLEQEKNLAGLLAAWRGVVALPGRSAQLHILGDGPLRDSLEHLIRDLGLESSVTLEGQVADVSAWLARADLFVLPSLAEGNSNALLEAMAAGLPAVATAVGGTPMLVGTEGAELLVPPGDPDALAATLARALDDAPLRARVGAAMRRRVEISFSIEKVAATYLEAYRRLRDGRARSLHEIASPLLRAEMESLLARKVNECAG